MNKSVTKQNNTVVKNTRTTNMITNIMKTMVGHVGEAHAINKYQLYALTYNNVYDPEKPMDWIQMEFMKKVIRMIRTKTTCFIVLSDKGYFVMSNKTELDLYQKQLNDMKAKLEGMEVRSNLAISEGWHKKKWEMYKADPAELIPKMSGFKLFRKK